MVNLSSKMFCRLDGLTPTARAQERLAQLERLGLLRHETIPVFDEAVQTAARLLNAPIGIFGLIVNERLWFKAAVGLSSIGLMNELAASRHLPCDESFSTYVIDSHQPLIVNQVGLDAVFSRSLLFQQYGVQAYLGVPLLTATGQCIGALAVWDIQPRSFTAKEVDILNLTARWCMSEFEQSRLRQENQKSPHEQTVFVDSLSPRPHLSSTTSRKSTSSDGINPDSLTTMDILKVKLLSHLTEELRTPLTSVMGMARVLEREVYGPLTHKQKEYVGIIHNSGQHLLSLVEEIVGLGVFEDNLSHLQLAPVDIEMLCQQAINNLYHIAKQERQQLRLSVEPGHRIWLLDKEKVRQMLYYLVYTVIQSSEAGSEVRIHISRKDNYLNIAVWVSHPWLGEGLPQVEMYAPTMGVDFGTFNTKPAEDAEHLDLPTSYQILTNSSLSPLEKLEQLQEVALDDSYRQLLGLVLSCHLAELHGGKIVIQGTAQSSYRYVFKLPKMDAE
jgi:signal transduction histidine kinase